MRSIVIILILFIVIVTVSVLYLLSVVSRLNITFDLFSIELKTLRLADFAVGKGFMRIGSKICVDNPNALGIKFSSLYYEVYYKNVLVIKSSEVNENLQRVSIQPNRITCFVTKSDVLINPQSLELVYKAQAGQAVELQYKVFFKLFFLNLSKEGILNR